MKYADLKYLVVQLPETILKEKWSGNFDNARRRIETILKDEETPYPLKARLELELNNLDYIQARYTISEKDALELLRQSVPDFTGEELETLRFENKVDWMYIDGEVKYLDTFHRTLIRIYPEFSSRMTTPESEKEDPLVDFINNYADGEIMKAHIHIKHELRVVPESVEEGKTLHVHLPIPHNRAGMSNLKIISTEPEYKHIAGPDVAQPTIYFEAPARTGQVFSVEYSVDNEVPYIDLGKVNPDRVSEAVIPEGEKVYLEEQVPHIVFTPYLKALCEKIVGDETNLLIKARKIYDYVTTKIVYRFVREYCSIDDLSSYCGLEKRGDCGIQALLFITLCRIAGVPAQWESGLDAEPNDVGEHDWVRFYIPSIGWVHGDVSFGGSAYRAGNKKRWDFFFGNVDPYRLPINSGFQSDFEPPKKHWRMDPYDNQCGEAEYDDRGLKGREYKRTYIDKGIHKVDK